MEQVREHHRKLRKAEKLKAKKGGMTLSALKKKDPGIPSMWPFKEELLKEVEDHKERVAKNKIEAALALKREREKRRKSQLSEAAQLIAMQQSARKRQNEFEMQDDGGSIRQRRGGIGGDVENTRRAYYRELHKIMESADVILEVLDARDPLGCRPTEVENYIQKRDPNKKIVLVLNKIDLVPKEMVTKWLSYLRREYPTVAIKCSTQAQRQNIGRSKTSGASASKDQLSGSSECIGGEQLLQLLKNYSRNAGMKMAVTVGVIGYPNVGKSSLINSLVRTRAVEAGAQAGITKVSQEVSLDKKVKLLDCPGIVFAKDESDIDTILRNCVKMDAVADPIPPVQEIVRRSDRLKLMTLYKLPRFGSPEEFVQLVAKVRGKMKKGGVLDLELAARSVLRDWNEGKIPYCTKPPEVAASSFESSEVVTAWGKDFKLDALQEVQVIDQACVAVDEAFVALQSLSLGGARGPAADMRFADAAERDDESAMDEEAPAAAGKKGDGARRPEKLPADGEDARATKAALKERAARVRAAQAKQAAAMGGESDNSDYDFAEGFAGEAGQNKFGALDGEESEEESEEEGEEEGEEEEGMEESGDEGDDDGMEHD